MDGKLILIGFVISFMCGVAFTAKKPEPPQVLMEVKEDCYFTEAGKEYKLKRLTVEDLEKIL